MHAWSATRTSLYIESLNSHPDDRKVTLDESGIGTFVDTRVDYVR